MFFDSLNQPKLKGNQYNAYCIKYLNLNNKILPNYKQNTTQSQMNIRLSQFLILSLAVLAGVVYADSVTESCIARSCKQEMTDCLSTSECNSQLKEMTECYANTEDCYSAEGLFDIEQTLTQSCIEHCLNSARLQTLYGSNLIRC